MFWTGKSHENHDLTLPRDDINNHLTRIVQKSAHKFFKILSVKRGSPLKKFSRIFIIFHLLPKKPSVTQLLTNKRKVHFLWPLYKFFARYTFLEFTRTTLYTFELVLFMRKF